MTQAERDKQLLAQLQEQVKVQNSYIRVLEQNLRVLRTAETQRKIAAGVLNYAKGC
jgi:hypothetical protein